MGLRRSGVILLFYHILAFNHIKAVSSLNEVEKQLCDLETDGLIRFYGYEVEVHNVTTDDGYILTIFRCYFKKCSPDKRKPVILQHGLLGSSDDFCIDPPDQSLAYILADAGYDVWIPNSRGNVYSRAHVSKDPDSPSSGFWDFSWFEMGIYDQPAAIDYILQETSSSKLHYHGYSQGTTTLFVLLSEKPEYNDKIHVAALMGPVAYASHVAPLYKLLSMGMDLSQTKSFEIFPKNRIMRRLQRFICEVFPHFCNGFVDFLYGPSGNQTNIAMLPIYMSHGPSGSAYKQSLHYAQEVKFGFFGKYKTGLRIPHDFPLSRITVPISLYYSTSDSLADAKDVEHLIPKLSNLISVQRIDTKFNHLDFIWGKQKVDLVYSKILGIFERYQ